MAVIISFNAYQQFLKQREKEFAVLDRVWAKMPKIPEIEAGADIDAALSNVRRATSHAHLKQKQDV
jgi:hypothetical protein